MVEVLGPLSARPPTPPRTAPRVLSEKDQTEGPPAVLQTPRDSPFLANESTGVPSSRQSKRVNFSPWTNYIKPPTFTNSTAKSKVPPPSNECKPTKSILKSTTTNGPVNSLDATTYTPETFAMLLESLTQQLAGESTSSRLDAYMQFLGALRAYEELPGEEEIVSKLGLITQFIQRDISRDLTNGGPMDTNLSGQALKLCVFLVWHPQISTHLSDDFRIFLVDHSISCLEDVKVPKSVITHYMSVLSTQRFHAKIMTTARTIRMLTVLHELTNRVKGSAIVGHRLSIYERVLEQSKSTFVSQSALWMDHLISGLLHHFKEIRAKALYVGLQSYLAAGPNPTPSKVIRDIFDRPLEEKRKLASEICERLTRMMANTDSCLHVPQIWGVITLLLRNKRFNIEQWEHFKKWVLVLQKCFNCSDSAVKQQAIGGWNRFVLVANPSQTTSRSLLKMLSKPILSQFDRKKPEKQGSQPSQLALSSYYNLLYYACSPSTSHQQLDIIWEEYIALPSSNIFSSVPSLSDRIAQVLSHMLWGSQAVVWSENRVNDANKLGPEELPSLDCKWLRSRIPSVLKVFEDIFKSSVWDADIEKSNIASAWVSLSRALSLASSKEITPSPESMQAVAHVLGLLQRLWNTGPSSLNVVGNGAMDTFFERFRFLSTVMIVALGGIPFTETLLLKTADATYQTASTPTHRHSRTNNNPDSPILHFLRLISDVSGISEPTSSYLHLINDTLEAACNGKVTRGSRLELLRQCADLYPNVTEFHFGVHNFAEIVWKSTAQISADSLRSFPSESARERDGSVSRDYENIVKVLSTGLKFPNVYQVWDQLIDAFLRVVRTEKGDRAMVTMVVEPIAEVMTSLKAQSTCLPAASLFNHSLSIPFFDHGSKTMNENGLQSDGHLSEGNEPLFPNKLIGLACRILREAYESFNPSEINDTASFIESLVSFLGSGVATFRSTLLHKLQEPLSLYLKDEARKLTLESGVESRVLTACRALSSAVLNILKVALSHDASALHRFEHIICAGLGSSHVSIAKRFIDFWTTTTKMQNDLRYPETVSQALRSLETHITIKSSRSPPPEGPQCGTQTRSSASDRARRIQKDPSAKSRIAFILDEPVQSSYSTRLNSSPVTREPEATRALSQEAREPSAVQHVQPEDTRDQRVLRDESVPLPSGPEETRRHSEVFSMIDSLRSSSPAGNNTPKELEFLTPPHLRSLRHRASEPETPLTPTLPPVTGDNEDGFLGSSPTPAIRGRTQSVASDIPPALTTSVIDSQIIDPPSSPPDLQSRSPDPEQKSQASDTSPRKDKLSKRQRKRMRDKSKRASLMKKKPIDESIRGEHVVSAGENAEELTLRSRLRSSGDKMLVNDEPTVVRQPRENPPKTMCQESSHSLLNGSVSQSPSKNSMPATETIIPDDQPMITDPSDYIADSCSDDMDTQVTSQLEYDLVFAVDLNGAAAREQVADTSEHIPVTRKRKREEEADVVARSGKDRRRSSRLSSTVAPATPETRSSHSSKKQKVTDVIPDVQSSPVGSVVKKRKHTVSNAETKSAKNDQGARRDNSKIPESQEAQKRRSSRISGIAAPDIPEETPPPKKFPHSSRSRKQNKKQKDNTNTNAPSEISQEKEAAAALEVPEASQATTQEESSAEDSHSQQLPEARDPSPIPSARTSPQPEAHPVQPTSTAEITPTIVEEAPHNDVQMTDAEIRTDSKTESLSSSSRRKSKKQAASETTQAETEAQPTPENEMDFATSLRDIMDKVKSASSLDRNTVKELDDLLFDLRFEMHEALRRHESSRSI